MDFPSLEDALSDPGSVTRLRLDEADDPLPVFHRFGEFVRLEHLVLWGVKARPSAVSPAVRSLDVLVEDPAELDQIARLFPSLERLEVWGRHLKSGVVPPSIAGLRRLRSLELVSCGIADLPDALAGLTELRRVAIRGCPITAFPLALARLPHLEELQLWATLTGLPDEVGGMGALRSLDLQGSLNGGLAATDAKFVRPIPPVLARLVGLESLGLGQCGVSDELDALHPLQSLRRLDVSWGRLRDLSGLAPLQALEELVLQSCYQVRDLAPLAALPRLRVLDTSGNHYLKDVSGLAACAALRVLNLEGCGDLVSLRPILELAGLEELHASDEIVAKWRQRQLLKDTPSKEELLAALATGSSDERIRALRIVASTIQLESTERGSAAFGFFGVRDDDELVDVPAVDRALDDLGDAVPTDVLVELVRAGLVSITQNLRFVLTAVELLCAREDEEAQRVVARQFHQACRYYDSGHRAEDDTVLDHLIDDLFPRFLPGPLAELLEPCGTDALHSDRMDQLFVAAFARPHDAATREKLVAKLQTYVEAMVGYGHGAEMAELHEAITEANPEVGALLEDRLGSARTQAALEEKVRAARSPEAVEALLAEIRSGGLTLAQADEVSAFSGRVVDALDGLSAETLDWLLGAIWDQGSTQWDWGKVVGHAFARDPVRARARLDARIAAHPEEKTRHAELLRLAKRVRPDDDPGLVAIRAAEAALTGNDPRELRAAELSGRLSDATNGYREEDWLRMIDALERIAASEVPAKRDPNVFMALQGRFETYVLMVAHGETDEIPLLRRFLAAFGASRANAGWSQREVETIAADAVAAAQLSKDPELERLAFALVPESVAKDRLAYNLACFHAVRGDRAEMLRWTDRALRLGKPPDQFRAESDFSAFHDDPELQALLARG